MTVTNENLLQEENKWTLISGNTYYHSVQKLLLCHQLSKNVKIGTYNYNFPVVFYGCETWSPVVREENRLRVSENRELRNLFGPKRNEVA
jgi:hypothetical protein